MSRRTGRPLAIAGALGLVAASGCAGSQASLPVERAVPNDNRASAGERRDGRVELRLEAGAALWQPEGETGPEIPVFAFSESGGPPRIPGPFLRVAQGTELRISVRNAIPEGLRTGLPPPNRRGEGVATVTTATLFVHGLKLGTTETLVVPYGEVREVEVRADTPGTFLYWAATADKTLWAHTGTDAQLAGAIVVDPVGEEPDPHERIFVITETDVFPDPSLPDPGTDVFELAINGLSWPYTERLRYSLGETVRWRWVNATHFQHPMHLHGFHFRTLARGDGRTESLYPQAEVQDVVTELMEPGSTFRMEWSAAREGNWMMHCHIIDHVIPFPERDEAERSRHSHDVSRHPLEAMAGLVLGITVVDDAPPETDGRPMQHLQLLAREKPAPGVNATIRGFALGEEGVPSAGEPSVPGPPLVLTRDETTRITVVNQMQEPTTVHWHGLELQSVYDGVAGWSRTGSRVAPLLAPGDTFDVFIRPPRAGTYIYHSHMDELLQVKLGMYGPLLVLEPGERFDPETDRIFVVADAIDGEHEGLTVNGRREPPEVTLDAGVAHRLRFINISAGANVDVALAAGGEILTWTARAKDGADLPAPLRREVSASFRMQAGETYDFEWRPEDPMTATVAVDFNYGTFGTEFGRLVLEQPIRVVSPDP